MVDLLNAFLISSEEESKQGEESRGTQPCKRHSAAGSRPNKGKEAAQKCDRKKEGGGESGRVRECVVS